MRGLTYFGNVVGMIKKVLIGMILLFSVVPAYIAYYYGSNSMRVHSFLNNEDLVTLQILHINDTHAYYHPVSFPLLNEKVSRLAVIKNFVNNQKQKRKHTLFVSAGDAMEKGSIADHVSSGQTTTDIYSQLGLDYITLGNHDFAYNIKSIVNFSNNAANTSLSANVRFNKELGSKSVSHHIYDIDGGVKIGIFGLTAGLFNSLNQGYKGPYYNGMTMDLDFVKVANEQVAILKESKVNFVIMLSHLGKSIDKHLAEHVSGIDFIIGGHSHKTVFKELFFAGVPWVETGYRANHVGELNFAFDKKSKKLIGHSYALYPIHPFIFGVDYEFNDFIKKAIGNFPESSDDPACNADKKYSQLELIRQFAHSLLETHSSDLVLLDKTQFERGLDSGALPHQNLFDVLPPQIQPPGTTGLASIYTANVTMEDFGKINQILPNMKKVYRLQGSKIEGNNSIKIIGHKKYLKNLGHHFSIQPLEAPTYLGENWQLIKSICLEKVF
tara:strand:- start:98726 stop:100216 length:1491 start_codon:yes stop_codon:yes gene_type:complete